jgi:hypothetical protein
MAKCFKCNKVLQELFDDSGSVNGGTLWTSIGNFGSRLFDAMSEADGHLELVICDECLDAGKTDVVHARKMVKTERVYVCDTGINPMTAKVPVTKIWVRKTAIEDFSKL